MTLSSDDINAAGLADWRPIKSALYTRFKTGNFATGLQLVNSIGEAAEAANHHPDIDLRYPHVNIRLYSHDKGGVTSRDVELARRISELAAGLGVSADPTAVAVFELALDTPDFSAIKPFWRAVLGYTDNPHAEDEVVDGDGDMPPLWFQQSGSDEPRQRFHVDINVPAEMVQARIDAALAAGGTLVDDTPSTFTVLADPEGNKVCVCW